MGGIFRGRGLLDTVIRGSHKAQLREGYLGTRCINIPRNRELTRVSIYLDNGNPVHALIVPVSGNSITSHLEEGVRALSENPKPGGCLRLDCRLKVAKQLYRNYFY